MVNPDTDELFTPSEARAWYDKATELYQARVREAESTAKHVVEVNRSLDKDRETVKRVYGEFLEKNPEIAKKVIASYTQTLDVAGEGENAYVKNAPISMLSYFNDVLQPHVELAERRAEIEASKVAAAKQKAEEVKRSENAQIEGADLRVNTPPEALQDDDGNEWDTAFDQYYGRKR